MKTNKEIIDKLVEYLGKKSSHKELARAFANLIIDLNRIRNWENLPIKEQESLRNRLNLNHAEFMRFVENNCEDESSFKVVIMNSEPPVTSEEGEFEPYPGG